MRTKSLLRRRLQDSPKRVRTLEERLPETKGQLAQAVSQNEKLTTRCEKLANTSQPCGMRSTSSPSHRRATASVLFNDDETADVHASGRKMRVAVQPELQGQLERGQEVANELFNIVLARRPGTNRRDRHH